jgi:hypothetical protein
MPDTVTNSDYYPYALGKKLIEWSTDTFKLLLMRSGFAFDRTKHKQLKNIKTNTGAISLTFVAATSKMTRGSGSFITDGFVVGNRVTTDATLNPGPFTILTVSALEIVFNEAVVNEGPVTKTATSDDELATGFGYVQYTKSPTMTFTEDDTNHWALASYPTQTWTTSGGNIGPSPCAILYDQTADVIVHAIIFGGGEQTAISGSDFDIQAGSAKIAG